MNNNKKIIILNLKMSSRMQMKKLKKERKKRGKKIQNMKTKTGMEMRIMMLRGNTYGVMRERTGTGTTKRIKKLMKEVILFILQF